MNLTYLSRPHGIPLSCAAQLLLSFLYPSKLERIIVFKSKVADASASFLTSSNLKKCKFTKNVEKTEMSIFPDVK